jgi:hypothetical protein
MLSKSCQKKVQKVVKKLSKSCQKVVKKLSKSCQNVVPPTNYLGPTSAKPSDKHSKPKLENSENLREWYEEEEWTKNGTVIRVLVYRDSPILWIDMFMPSAHAVALQWPRAQSLNSQDCGSEGITPYIWSVVT